MLSWSSPPRPNAAPAVQSAYAAYLNAWIEVANQPGLSERSVAQEADAQAAQYRLYLADKGHETAFRAASRAARQPLSCDAMTPAEWQAKYPLLNMDRETEAE